MATTKQLYGLFRAAGKLKRIKRTGWIKCSIKNPESVADHCFRMAFVAMIMSDILGLDTNKIMRMALLHDLGEAKVGDLTPNMGITREEKRELEKKALGELFSEIGNGNYYIQLWEEYEEGISPEAKLLKDIDKFEMAMQAIEYKSASPQINLDEFFLNAKHNINLRIISELLENVLDLRNRFNSE